MLSRAEPVRVPLLSTLNDYLSKAQIALGIALMVVFVTLTFAEIVSRYALARSLIWAPEIATMALIWSVFLASAVCFRNNAHLAVDMISPSTPFATRLNGWFVAACNLTYLGAVAWFAYAALPIGMRRGTPILDIPLSVGWLALFIMGVSGVGYTIENILRGRVLEPVEANEIQ